MTLVAYFDDSESHGETRVHAVGGVIASQEAWSGLFEDAWRSFLRRNNLPYFRMSQFENRQGPYRSWSNEKRVFEITEALAIIKRTVRAGVGVGIEHSTFLQYGPRLGVKHPYHLCAHWCLLLMAIWRKNEGFADPIASVFEAGSQGVGDLRKSIDDLGALNPDAVAGPMEFAGKTDRLPLQAADLMAYEIQKQALREYGVERPRRKSLKALEGGGMVFLSQLLTDDLVADLWEQHEDLRRSREERADADSNR